MKKIIGIALALALVMGVAAFAEGTTDTATDSVPATPAVTEETTTSPAEEATATDEVPAATADVEKVEDENKALQDALEAYHKAKQDKAVSNLEEELNEYVAAGSMTQEQADLILKNVKERMAAKNGECPNCGYDLRGGMKGQQRGGKMGGMQRGGRMNGNMNDMQRGKMNGQQQMRGGMQRPDAQSGATPRQGGMQMPQMPGQQQVPQMNGGQQPGMAQPQM